MLSLDFKGLKLYKICILSTKLNKSVNCVTKLHCHLLRKYSTSDKCIKDHGAQVEWQ
jgi:hypothetical protein